jgi:hypothetical protein
MRHACRFKSIYGKEIGTPGSEVKDFRRFSNGSVCDFAKEKSLKEAH